MAAVGKKKITIDVKINPYGETKTKKAPQWFVARPDAGKAVSEISVKRTMELDPRKWKKKTLEDGVYAVARYELARFATILATQKQQIVKALPAKEKKKKFTNKTKDESKEVNNALDKAETEVKKSFNQIAKIIEDKISLALDEVESDKGDNKQSLAAGKEALKQFDKLDTDNMFSKPTDAVVKLLTTLGNNLKDGGENNDSEFTKAAAALDTCKKDFATTGKKAQNVVKYLLYKGEKMAKKKDSDPSLQEVGKLIIGQKVKPDLEKLSANIGGFENQLDEIASFLKKKTASADIVKNRSRSFETDNKNKDSDLRDAVKSVKNVSDQFNKAVKEVKK